MKQNQTKQLRECLASTLSTLHFETSRINANLSVMHMLIDTMRREKADSWHIDSVNAVRLALIDCLGELEKQGFAVYKTINGGANEQ